MGLGAELVPIEPRPGEGLGVLGVRDLLGRDPEGGVLAPPALPDRLGQRLILVVREVLKGRRRAPLLALEEQGRNVGARYGVTELTGKRRPNHG